MSVMVHAEHLPQEVQKAVSKVLREQLGDRLGKVKFLDFEVENSSYTVIIEIGIKPRPETRLSDGGLSLFGLTRQVRDAMGNIGETVFPVLRPVSSST